VTWSKRRVLEKIPEQLEAAFQIFLTLGSIKQSSTLKKKTIELCCCFSLKIIEIFVNGLCQLAVSCGVFCGVKLCGVRPRKHPDTLKEPGNNGGCERKSRKGTVAPIADLTSGLWEAKGLSEHV